MSKDDKSVKKMFLHANMDSARQIPDIYVFSETTDSICAAEIAFRFLKKKYWELTTFFDPPISSLFENRTFRRCCILARKNAN